VLMVTSTVGVLYGVHSNTASGRPAVPLGLVFVVSTASFEHRLVSAPSTGDNADHGTGSGLEGLLGTGRQTNAGAACLGVVADDGSVIAGGTGEFSAVAGALLDVADHGSFGHVGHRKHVTDDELGFLTAVDGLSSVHTLAGNKSGLDLLELVWVAKRDTGERGATSRVMDDFPDDTFLVSVACRSAKHRELGGSLAVAGVGFEDAPCTFPLRSDHFPHGDDDTPVVLLRSAS